MKYLIEYKQFVIGKDDNDTDAHSIIHDVASKVNTNIDTELLVNNLKKDLVEPLNLSPKESKNALHSLLYIIKGILLDGSVLNDEFIQKTCSIFKINKKNLINKLKDYVYI